MRAQEALRTGDVVGAERLLVRAVAEPSPDIDVLLLMSAVRRRQNRLDEAESFARRAAAADTNSGRATGRLGALLQFLGRLEEARDAYKEALRREPGLDPIRVSLVRCLLAMGAFAEAEAEAAALAARRREVLPLTLLSEARHAQDKGEEALTAADEALRLAPADRSAMLAKARALGKIGRASEATDAYKRLRGAGFEAVEEAIGAAQAMHASGESAEAEALLAHSLTRWPNDAQLLSALCKLRWVNGVGADFAKPMLAAVAARPTDMRLRLACADLLQSSEQLAAAEQTLRDGLTHTPGDVVLLSSLGVVLDNAGRLEDAIAALDGALRGAPNDDRLHANRATVLIRLGRADEALAELAPLLKKQPDGQRLIAYEALALRLKGDPRYHALYNYERYVRTFELETPPGYSSLAAFNEELADRVTRLYGPAEHPLDQSLRNGTQTSQNLAHASDPVIRAYIAALDAPVRAYVEGLPDDPADPMGRRKATAYRIWSCWSVRLRGGGFHVNHIHPQGWISSSYYIKVPPPAPGDAPHAGWIKFGEPNMPVPGCGPELFIEPTAGKLVLFPSYMWHGTVPFAEGERITMPFDVVPSSQ